MWVPPLYLDTMYGPHSQSTNSRSMEAYRDRKTAGGVVSYSLVAVAIVAAVVVPAVMLGVVLGVAGMKLRTRVAALLRRRRGGEAVLSPDADAGHPT